jgi:hypothetical protein
MAFSIVDENIFQTTRRQIPEDSYFYSQGDKGRPARGTANLTAICEPIV